MPPSNLPIIRPLSGMVAALGRLYESPPDAIRGIKGTEWGSPLQPAKPMAPEGTEPRGFQWWWGQNLQFTPRPDAQYSSDDLKALATYPLARIIIENVKDRITKAEWEIQLKPKIGETKKDRDKRSKGDATIKKLNDFFIYPDSEHNWSEWLRPLLEDMLVIDAATILIRETFKGDIAELRVLRGESITRLIDANGYTPLPPSPAYQQVWWGLPIVNLTTDQLVYKPRNIVPRGTQSSQLYGMSPTEQLADEIKVGMKRLEFVLAYYTEGSIPGVVHVVPKGTPPDKIAEAMMWMNSELAGNLATRQQWRMIPGFNEAGKDDQIIFSKQPLLADTYDELHIRKLCYGYGESPQRLMRMMGTRNAEEQQASADEEGLLPWLNYIKGLIDHIIQRRMKLSNYEIIFEPFKESDLVKEAQSISIYVRSGVITPNEGRERIGEDPRSEPEADMLGTIGGAFTPIGGEGALSNPKPEVNGDRNNGASPNAARDNGEKGTKARAQERTGFKPDQAGVQNRSEARNPPKQKTNGHGITKGHCSDHPEYQDACIWCAQNEIRRLEKLVPPIDTEALARRGSFIKREFTEPVGFAAGATAVAVPRVESFNIVYERSQLGPKKGLQIKAGDLSPSVHDSLNRFAQIMTDSFARQKQIVLNVLTHAHVFKVHGGVSKRRLRKQDEIDDEKQAKLIKKMLDDLETEYASLPSQIRDSIEQAVMSGLGRGIAQVNVTDAGLLAEINQVARDWAVNRSAELVGMKYDEEGNLVTNPNPRWAISDTTRNKLKEIVADVFNQPSPREIDFLQRIEDAGTFSESRAKMIAKTETIRAEVNGNLEVWRETGLVKKVGWRMSADHDRDDVCDENEANGPYDIDEVPEFPAHPNCECILALEEIE